MQLAVDLVITDNNRVALIRRKHPPFQDAWCLPGGHVEDGERLEQAAKREAQEETGLMVDIHGLVGVYDALDRDPRGRIISITYHATPIEETGLTAATDASDAAWFPLDDLPELGFDHATILDDYQKSI